MLQPLVGIIGGSGLYDMPGLSDVEQREVETPFGRPSAPITVGQLDGIPVAFLPRHGLHHQISPSNIPMRANVWALKQIGVERLLSVSAVGSMRETIRPLDFVVPDQIYDRTVNRERTFFDDAVAHVALAEPFCEDSRRIVADAMRADAVTVHDGGTYICIEGPQFSTKGESRIYRAWGVDIIGMTAMPEARLAREAGLCYVTLAMVTDYDVWHESEEAVSVLAVIENLRKNVVNAQQVIRVALPGLSAKRNCSCGTALENAVVTAPDGLSTASRERMDFLLNGPRR
jgi:5'-methylthioadenosine phosphorylase